MKIARKSVASMNTAIAIKNATRFVASAAPEFYWQRGETTCDREAYFREVQNRREEPDE